MQSYLCFDIGGTEIKYALFNQEGEKLTETQSLATPRGDRISTSLFNVIDTTLLESKIAGIAISSAGVVDHESGEIIFAGPTIPGYIGVNLKASIVKKYGIQTSIENDVNAAALGEYWKGAAQNSCSTFMVTIGTGVGGAFLIKDKLWRGHSMSAGEIGYLNTNSDYFQNKAASSVMVKKVNAKRDTKIDGKEVFLLAKKGDLDCIQAIDDLVTELTFGLADIMYMLNPETLVLGGGIMAQKDYLEPLIHKKLDSILIGPRFKAEKIEFASCGNDAGMVGALFMLLNNRKG